LNAALPIVVTLVGKVMLVKLVQLLNALSLILVKLIGITMLASLEPWNAKPPILVTLFGIV
jgi:hypothetical protein